MPEVVVIGAGITGLACAWRLKRLGVDALVLEASDRPGGVIQSERAGDYLIEHGPNSILPSSENFSLLDESGVSSEIVEGERRAPRYVCINRKLQRVPFGPMSLSGMVRAAAEPFVRSKSPDDESIHDFFTRRFGTEVESRLASPFVTGIYAGNSRALGIRATFPKFVEMERLHGSLIVGMFKSRKPKGIRTGRTCSFRNGMETLTRKLASGLNIRYGVADFDAEANKAKAAVVTAPAYRTADLLRQRLPNLSSLLDKVDYAPMIVATSTLSDSAFPQPLRGFGFLVPRSEKLHLLGTLFSSTLFPGRAPQGQQLLTSFIGGALEREAIEWSDDKIWEMVRSELQVILKTNAAPEPLRLIRRTHAIPQYNVGHERWTAAVKEELKATPGLFLAGNYMDGVSVAACIETGERTAREAAVYVRSHR